MSNKPTKPDDAFRPDPNRAHPPIDESVKLPRQVRLAATHAEGLIAGKQPQAAKVKAATAKSGSASKIPYPDAQIDAVLKRWDQGNLNVSDRDFGIIIELAREGARLIKAHRRGAQKARKTSPAVTRRLEALVQAFRELSPKFQQNPTGQQTIERLRRAIMKSRSLRALSEDTVRQDIRQVRPLLRLVQKGKIPPPGQPRKKPELSERTRREMEAGRAAVARHAAANTPPELSERPVGPDDDF